MNCECSHKYIKMFILMFFIMYILFSIGSANFIPFEWSGEARYWFGFFCTTPALFLFILNYLNSGEQK